MKKIITILLMSTFVTVLYGQTEQNQITVKGVTTGFTNNSNAKLNDVSIHIYKFNKLVGTLYSNNKGKFEFEIPKNSYITLVFEKDNFVSKRILFDTRTEKEVKQPRPFDLEIMLIENIDGVDYSNLDFPITKIMFIEEMNDYSYATKYTKLMLKKQEEVLMQIEQKTLANK